MNIQQLYNFTDHTVVISGGAGVLGSHMVRALVSLGANVAILGRNLEKARKLQQQLDTKSDSVLALQSDVTKREVLEENAQEIIAKFDKIDSLINVAGGNHKQATTNETQNFFDLPGEALKHVVDLNLLGTIYPCQVFGKHMIQQKQGNIINISSMAAERPLTRIPAYSSAKAALDNFTKWLAVHIAQEYTPNIRVNAVAPGFFLTEQNRFLLTDETTGELTARGKSIISHTPMNRFGNPEDLLGVILWLLSPASSFVTGVVIPVDGGFSAYAGV